MITNGEGRDGCARRASLSAGRSRPGGSCRPATDEPKFHQGVNGEKFGDGNPLGLIAEATMERHPFAELASGAINHHRPLGNWVCTVIEGNDALPYESTELDITYEK